MTPRKLRKKSGYGSLSPCEGASGRVEQDAAERVCQVNQSGMRIIRQLPDIKAVQSCETPALPSGPRIECEDTDEFDASQPSVSPCTVKGA